MPDSEATRAAKTAIIQTLGKAKPGEAAVALEALARHFAELGRVQERIRRMVKNYERRGTMVERIFCDACNVELGTAANERWLNLTLYPMSDVEQSKNHVEADLCYGCAGRLTADEVLALKLTKKEVPHA